MAKKCPGQSLRRKTPEQAVQELECPECGYQVEFFPTDSYRDCPECGTKVEKTEEQLEEDLVCAYWCPAAKECLGPDLSRVKSTLKQNQDKTLQELLNSIPEEEREVRTFFRKAYRESKDDELLIDTQKTVKPLKDSDPELHAKVVKYYFEFTKGE